MMALEERKTFRSTVLGPLAGSGNETGKDRVTGEKHIEVINVLHVPGAFLRE